MRNFIITLLFCASLLQVLSGCETNVDFPKGNRSVVCISAIATPDSDFTVVVSLAQTGDSSINESAKFREYYLYEGLKLSPQSSLHFGRTDSLFFKQLLMKHAQVSITVNGAENYVLHFDGKLGYVGSYVPRSGDVVHIDVHQQGFPSASATLTVPATPQLQLISHYETYHKPDFDDTYAGRRLCDDTAMVLNFKITDPAGEKNYYRLNVLTRVGSDYLSLFSSADPVFKDSQIAGSWGNWPAGFSTAFSDDLMQGKGEYQLSITVQKMLFRGRIAVDDPGSYYWPRVIVQLQSISPELYRYVKSYEIYRSSFADKMRNPVQIFSNVDGGLGIAGGLTPSPKITVNFQHVTRTDSVWVMPDTTGWNLTKKRTRYDLSTRK